MTAETPKQTPLVDLLRGVPSDGRAIYEHSTTHSQSIPYGRLCHDAANDLTAAREQIAAWQEKAAVWMASPEAAKRLAGYREMADKCCTLEAERDAARARVAELETEAAEHKESFDIYWRASKRATAMWQEAHPDRSHVWPDMAHLCVWLMERIDRLELGLKPFANFACDEPCQCNNCVARALLAPPPEPQP